MTNTDLSTTPTSETKGATLRSVKSFLDEDVFGYRVIGQ